MQFQIRHFQQTWTLLSLRSFHWPGGDYFWKHPILDISYSNWFNKKMILENWNYFSCFLEINLFFVMSISVVQSISSVFFKAFLRTHLPALKLTDTLHLKMEWVFPKIRVPPNHPLNNRVFHHFHHPILGVKSPHFWFNTRMGWKTGPFPTFQYWGPTLRWTWPFSLHTNS